MVKYRLVNNVRILFDFNQPLIQSSLSHHKFACEDKGKQHLVGTSDSMGDLERNALLLLILFYQTHASIQQMHTDHATKIGSLTVLTF